MRALTVKNIGTTGGFNFIIKMSESSGGTVRILYPHPETSVVLGCVFILNFGGKSNVYGKIQGT